jgi:hypothetical protein
MADTLRTLVRPLVGGLQIRFSGFLCTLGFSANDGFVVNSHCTDNESTLDNTLYYQPLNQVAGEFIGTEILDPPFFTSNQDAACPRNRKCRWSDAAFARLAGGVTATLGALARTTGANNGSLEIAGTFSISTEAATSDGDRVNKVGRTTGWTQGTVTNTCVHTGVGGGGRVVRLCQDWVSAGVGSGDSGSPVFKIISADRVELRGILWGGNSSGTVFVYSPIQGIEKDLGELGTH